MSDVILDLLGDPIPEGHGQPGRPEHIATERNRLKIKLLLAEGWTVKRIASTLRITAKTLRKHYSLELRARDVALDQLKAAHRAALVDQMAAGNTAATKEVGRLIDRIDAANFGVVGTPRVEKKEAKALRLGKKEEQSLAAQTAGEGSDWGNDLLPASRH